MKCPPVYIIIPVHNRRDITLKCLEVLNKSGALDKYYIVIVDDGSTDGTHAAIVHEYQHSHPNVMILEGDGNLWWMGAIRWGMNYGYEQGAEFFIWLNDDTFPIDDAIDQLLAICHDKPKTIASAQCYATSECVTPTYGAHKFNQLLMNSVSVSTPSNHITVADALSGNLVCLPRYVVDDIGLPDPRWIHHGDHAYTWKAKQNGYRLLTFGSIRAVCIPDNFDSNSHDWLIGDIPLIDHVKSFSSPKSVYHPPSRWYRCISTWGALGIIVFIRPYLQLLRAGILRWLFPRSFLLYLKTKLNT